MVDKQESYIQGLKAEYNFIKTAKREGFKVGKAPNDKDINAHWDYLIKKGKLKLKVDVKAMKKINRYDEEVQDEWVWIELHGVRNSDFGWLYGGEADIIAFEMKDSFYLVEREALIELIDGIVDFKMEAFHATDAQYKVYSRLYRPDKLTLINKKDLERFVWKIWKKH